MEKDNWDPEFIKKTKIENEKRKKHLATKKKRMYKKRIISIALLVMFLLPRRAVDEVQARAQPRPPGPVHHQRHPLGGRAKEEYKAKENSTDMHIPRGNTWHDEDASKENRKIKNLCHQNFSSKYKMCKNLSRGVGKFFGVLFLGHGATDASSFVSD